MSRWHGVAVSFFGLTGIWQLVVWSAEPPAYILPGPAAVAVTIWDSRVILAENAVVTMTEVLLGLGLGAIIGGLSAIFLAASGTARVLIRPMMVVSQSIPVFALAPVLTLWLGFGLESKVAMAVLIIYFPVTSAFFDALVRINPDWIDMARVLGGSSWRVMWHIRIPAALPGLATGVRLAAVYAPIGAVIGEWVGASKGLGYLMMLANGRARTDLMFAALAVLAVLTVLLHAVINHVCARALDERR